MLRAILYSLIVLLLSSILAAWVATWFAPQKFASLFVGYFAGGAIALFILAAIFKIAEWRRDRKRNSLR